MVDGGRHRSAAAPAASSSPSHSSDASTEEHRWLLAPINVSARARIDLSLFFPHHHQHARPGGAAASEARPRRFTRDLHTDHPRPRFLCLDVSLSPVLAAIDEAQLTAIIGAVATAEQASALSLEAAEMAAADRRLPNPAAQREYVHLTRALLFEEETRQASRQARDTAAARDGGDGGREHDGEHGDGEMRDPEVATTAPAAGAAAAAVASSPVALSPRSLADVVTEAKQAERRRIFLAGHMPLPMLIDLTFEAQRQAADPARYPMHETAQAARTAGGAAGGGWLSARRRRRHDVAHADTPPHAQGAQRAQPSRAARAHARA